MRIPGPPLRVGRRRRSRPAPLHIFCVYRRANAGRLAPLVADLVAGGAAVSLWGLDGVAPELEAQTVGSGPGLRCDLHNTLVERGDPSAEAWWCFIDDDVVVDEAGLRQLVGVADVADFSLSQPGHVEGSHLSHPFTRCRPHLVARSTTWVECGPVLLVAPWAHDVFVPFPEGTMGWGLSLEWYRHALEGHRFGIVDSVGVRHLNPPGEAYDRQRERDRLDAVAAATGLTNKDVKKVVARWGKGRRSPPWGPAPLRPRRRRLPAGGR